MSQKIPHILLVEDELHLAKGITFNLQMEGYRVTHTETGEEALEKLNSNSFSLVVLDIMLPGMDGFEVCRKLRRFDTKVPVLMLTARGEEADRITGLSSGADDYLVKPFSLGEFLLRVKGMLRRSSWYRAETTGNGYSFGNNVVYLSSYSAETPSGPITLTELEIKMLSLFFSREGEVISRKEILESVWGYVSDTETRTLDNFIVRLRKYFEADPAQPAHFQTVRGVGYRFLRSEK